MSDPAAVRELLARKSVFVFDFDGVLVDSVDIKTQAFAELYAPYGVDVVDQVVAHHRANGGMSRYEKFPLYHERFIGKQLSANEAAELEQRFSKWVIDKVIAAPEIPGATEFVRHYAQHASCVINSATPEDELQTIISGRDLTEYFEGVYGSPDNKLQNLKKILSHFQVSPEECVFFGDALADYEAAKNTRVDFVGVGLSILELLQGDASAIFHCNDFLSISP